MGVLDARDPAGRLVWPWPAAVAGVAIAVQAWAGRPAPIAAAHGLVAVALWLAVRAAASRYGTALAAGALFAAHPVLFGSVAVTVAAVAYVAAGLASAACAVAIAAIGARGRVGARVAVLGTLAAAAGLAAWTLSLGR